MHGYAANAISNISVPSNLVSRVRVSDLMFEYHHRIHENEICEIAQITNSINWFGLCVVPYFQLQSIDVMKVLMMSKFIIFH